MLSKRDKRLLLNKEDNKRVLLSKEDNKRFLSNNKDRRPYLSREDLNPLLSKRGNGKQLLRLLKSKRDKRRVRDSKRLLRNRNSHLTNFSSSKSNNNYSFFSNNSNNSSSKSKEKVFYWLKSKERPRRNRRLSSLNS